MLKPSLLARTFGAQAFPTNLNFLASHEQSSDSSADLYRLRKGQLEMQQPQVKANRQQHQARRGRTGTSEQEAKQETRNKEAISPRREEIKQRDCETLKLTAIFLEKVFQNHSRSGTLRKAADP